VQRSGRQQRIICEHGTEVFPARSLEGAVYVWYVGSIPTSGGAVYNEHMSRKSYCKSAEAAAVYVDIAGGRDTARVLREAGILAL
jgi:hypothetical protein